MKTPEGRFTGDLVASVGGEPAAPAPPESGPSAVAQSKARKRPAAATIPILDDHPVDLKLISGALGFEDQRAPGRPIDARKLPGQVVGWLQRLSVKSSNPRFTRE